MPGIPIEGTNATEALVDEGTDIRSIMEDESDNLPDFDGDGRVFELLALEITNEHATQVATVELWDSDEDATFTADPSIQKGTYLVPAQDTVQFTWARGTGPRFITNITASIDSGNGTVDSGAVRCSGVLY